MADMIKFYKGLEASLPAAGANGALYVTIDEGAIYLGTGTGMKRLGDFVQVDKVDSLPAKAHESCLYYCVAENILAKWNGTEWKQINKQPTAEEMKTLLGLGSAAYTDASAYDKAGAADAVRAYVGEIPEGYTEETVIAYINKKAEETLNAASGGSSESAASVLAALNTYKSENDPKVTANTNAIAAIKDGTTVDSFADVEAELAKKVDKVEGKSLVSDTEITKLAGVSEGANKVEASETNGNIKIDGVETVVYTHPEKHAIADVDGLQDALDGKQDVIPENTYDAYGSAAQALADAKAYADANDADTKYGITYDSENKKIKLVEGGSEVEIDASAFIKDGMINTVTIDENDDLIITFNTDAGKENIVLPLDQLVDIYTGVEGAKVKVTVASDKSISADLVAGSISKNYLDDGVQASLALADSALQEHQDISHLATEADLTLAENRIAELEAIDHEAYVAADTALKTELQAEIDADVKALADGAVATNASNIAANAEAIATKANSADVYAKTETYTQDEVDAAIEAAVTAATEWGSF